MGASARRMHTVLKSLTCMGSLVVRGRTRAQEERPGCTYWIWPGRVRRIRITRSSASGELVQAAAHAREQSCTIYRGYVRAYMYILANYLRAASLFVVLQSAELGIARPDGFSQSVRLYELLYLLLASGDTIYLDSCSPSTVG